MAVTDPSHLHAKQLLATDAYSVGSLTSAGDLTTTSGDVVIGAAKDLKLNGTALASSGGAAKVGVNPAGWVNIAGSPSTVQAAFTAVEAALAAGGAGVTGAGSNGYIAHWTGANTLSYGTGLSQLRFNAFNRLEMVSTTSSAYTTPNTGVGFYILNQPAIAGGTAVLINSNGAAAGSCLRLASTQAGTTGLHISTPGQSLQVTCTGNTTAAIIRGNATSSNPALELAHVSGQANNVQLLRLSHSTGGSAHILRADGSHLLYSATASIPNGAAITLKAADSMSAPNSYTFSLPPTRGTNDGGIYGGNEVLITDGNGTTSWRSPQTLRRRLAPVSTATYNAIDSDNLILVNRAGAVTITLPTANAGTRDKIFIIKDISGNAGVNNITTNVSGGGTIDGAASIVITVNYGVLKAFNDGTNWYTL